MEGMENHTSGIAKPQEGKMKEQMLGSENLMEAKKKEIMSCRPKPMDGIEKENRLGSAKPKEGKEKEQMSDNAKEQGMKNEGALGSAKLMEEGDKEKKSDSTKLMDVKEKEQMSGSVKLLKVIEEQISGSVKIIDEKEKKQMTGSAKPMKDKEQISSKAQPMEGKEKEQIAGCTKSMEGKEKEQVSGSTKLLRWSIRRDSFPLVSIRNALLKRRNLSPDNLLWRRRSTGNFAAGAAGGGCGVPRSAPATPLQLEPTPRAKHEKHAFKPLSGSAPSVRVSEDAKEGKQPSKARQKKFQRHFPQVGPEERVLNYYSCALVGDLLLQGHLYITKNYFAFYSNVFGYVTKLLIPTTSVLRITKEKVARIIPNAVGVCTRDERHVFGSLLSRDSTYKLMTHVWKSARTPELVLPSKVQDLRVSEVELDASEYSPEDDSSSAGGDRLDAPEPVVRRESEAIITTAGAAVIQPALLTGGTAPKRRATHWHAMLIFFAVFLTFTAIYLAYRLYLSRFQPPEDLMKLSGEELYTELVRWRSRLHGRAAGELHSFLTTNLLLLTKVRQSLEALSGVILTDMAANAGHAPADPVFS